MKSIELSSEMAQLSFRYVAWLIRRVLDSIIRTVGVFLFFWFSTNRAYFNFCFCFRWRRLDPLHQFKRSGQLCRTEIRKKLITWEKSPVSINKHYETRVSCARLPIVSASVVDFFWLSELFLDVLHVIWLVKLPWHMSDLRFSPCVDETVNGFVVAV